MKKINLARIFTVVALSVVLFSSCATKKKYGCPTHIIERIFSLM